MILERRMPFSFFEAGAAERDALVDEHVVADFDGLAEHHAHPMIDEQAPADCRAGMNLDASEPSRQLADHPAKKLAVMLPEPVREAVKPDRMQSRVREHDLERGARGRVAVKDRLDVFPDSVHYIPGTFPLFRRGARCVMPWDETRDYFPRI